MSAIFTNLPLGLAEVEAAFAEEEEEEEEELDGCRPIFMATSCRRAFSVFASLYDLIELAP